MATVVELFVVKFEIYTATHGHKIKIMLMPWFVQKFLEYFSGSYELSHHSY
jgi:hypothetical protein